MNIQKLKLSHFRNYEAASFSFELGMISVLTGKNAQGKTNILEAIYYLSYLRSWRTLKTISLCQFESGQFALDCEAESRGRSQRLRVMFDRSKKYLFADGNPVKTFSSFVGRVNAVLFSPDDLNLFSLPPKIRRQFMDMELVKLSRSYTGNLSRFQQVLKERNLLLKARNVNRVLLSANTDQLIAQQITLIEQRSRFLKRLEEKANAILPLFTDNEETLSIRYVTCADPNQSREDLKVQFEKLYEQNLDRDLLVKSTSVGIHKDDVEFFINGRLVTQTASQGQKRSVMLSVRLGLCEMIKEASGEYPILLLDDVFSELDDMRRARLIQALPENMQIFITTADPVSPSWFNREVSFYTVMHGKMKEGIYDV